MDSLWPPGGLQKPSLKNSALIHYSGVRFPKTTMVASSFITIEFNGTNDQLANDAFGKGTPAWDLNLLEGIC